VDLRTGLGLLDKVCIDESDVRGVVTTINVSCAVLVDQSFRIMYEVQWFANGCLQTAWFDEKRLKRVAKER
jgi:hypothetical protein